MKNIKFFALGGLGEYGKNMYVIEVKNDLYILDAGLKYPTNELFGVDEIIPDYKILIPAKKRIKGIFISHAHEDHVGALPYILQDLNVPIYGTKLSLEIIKDSLKEADLDLKGFSFVTVQTNQTVDFESASVSFFDTTHSIPESVGIAIETSEGTIVYTSEFSLINQGKDNRYRTDFQKINSIANNKILALLIESVGSYKLDFQSNDLLRNELESIYNQAEGRIIVSLFSSDLQKIQYVIDISLAHNKKIAIIGRKAQRIVDIAIEEGYLNIPKNSLVNLRYIDDKNKNDDKNLVCLVTGRRHEPFYMLQRIAKKVDRLIHIDESDTVVFLTSPVPGTEAMAARTIDILYRSDAKVVRIPKELLSTSHASSEEVKLMIGLFKPHYIIPVIGEYSHQARVKNLAKEIGYKDKEILLLDNGDVATFEKDSYYISKEDVRADEILIDGTPIDDKNDIIMKDRERLAEDGLILIIANVNAKKREVVDNNVEVVAKGFTCHSDFDELSKQMKKIFMKASEKELSGKYVNWNDYKRRVRDDISSHVWKKVRRRPIVIPVIISTE